MVSPIESATLAPPTPALPSTGGHAFSQVSSATSRTIWGLDPLQLHTRFWAAHGVQVVRQGEPSEIVHHAELYLLLDSRSLVMFPLSSLMTLLNWVRPQVLFVRVHDSREKVYRERVVTDEADRFIRFQRIYDTANNVTRVVITPEREVAQLWQASADPISGGRRLRHVTPRADRVVRSVQGHAYDLTSDREVALFLADLQQSWRRPDSTVLRARHGGAGGANGAGDLWSDPTARLGSGSKFIGPVWVGAGRTVAANTTVIGPAMIWDDPQHRPSTEAIQWLAIQPTAPPIDPSPRNVTAFEDALKRGFDIVVTLLALLVSVPLYPFIMLAIWLEDGRPFFFAHRRETLGGREFPCLKFRSMRKDAEKVKELLKRQNQADGPQFYMENDPRLTRVGAFLRKYNLDELPQFLNVLAGDMSVVGPRPSPHRENQFCPPWREARLSVRPGITGLWQVRRTRRAGADFQEWIKYDIEYVENRSFWLDLKIIYKTFMTIVRKGTRT